MDSVHVPRGKAAAGSPAAWGAVTVGVLGAGAAAAWAAFGVMNRIDNSPADYDRFGGGLWWSSVCVYWTLLGASAWLRREPSPGERERMVARAGGGARGARWVGCVRQAGRLGLVCLVAGGVMWFLPSPFGLSRVLTAGSLGVMAGVWGARALGLGVRGVLGRPEPRAGVGVVLAAGGAGALLLLMSLMKLNGLAWAKAID